MYISHVSTWGDIADVITRAKFCVYRFMGFGVLTPPIFLFAVGLPGHPYNNVRTTTIIIIMQHLTRQVSVIRKRNHRRICTTMQYTLHCDYINSQQIQQYIPHKYDRQWNKPHLYHYTIPSVCHLHTYNIVCSAERWIITSIKTKTTSVALFIKTYPLKLHISKCSLQIQCTNST